MPSQSAHTAKPNFRLAWWQVLAIGMFLIWAAGGTGLATDDFVHLTNALSAPWSENLLPRAYVSVPVLHYTHALAYQVIGDHLWAYGLVKGLYLTFTACALIRFLALFVAPARAFMGALVFLLSPVHDAATLWLTGQYLILSLGFYLLAFVAAHENRNRRAVVWALLGSFSSYGSPPLAAGLGLMLLMQRRWRAALALILPNAAYVAYYAYTSMVLKAGTARLPGRFDAIALAKNYAVQIASFLDAASGPSAWFKFALSFASLSLISLMLAVPLAVWLWRIRYQAGDARHIPVLWAGAGTIALSAFGIFALTGAYPQVAFNLGDRVALYGNLLLSLLLLQFAGPRLLASAAILCLAAFLGVTDHWKNWNGSVQQSIGRIRAQPGLATVKPEELVFVSGLQYSRLGPMTHIDHFTANYVIRDVFAYARPGQPRLEPVGFNRRLQLEGDVLVDIKYGDRFRIGDSILLYDAEADTLARIVKEEIPAKIAALPLETRHWTQLLGPGLARNTIVWLMPGLKYAYP